MPLSATEAFDRRAYTLGRAASVRTFGSAADPLPRRPRDVPGHGLVGEQRLAAREAGAEGHFVVERVQAAMAEPADENAGVELCARVAAPETRAPVELLRDQMMEGEFALGAAERADAGGGPAGGTTFVEGHPEKATGDAGRPASRGARQRPIGAITGRGLRRRSISFSYTTSTGVNPCAR